MADRPNFPQVLVDGVLDPAGAATVNDVHVIEAFADGGVEVGFDRTERFFDRRAVEVQRAQASPRLM